MGCIAVTMILSIFLLNKLVDRRKIIVLLFENYVLCGIILSVFQFSLYYYFCCDAQHKADLSIAS